MEGCISAFAFCKDPDSRAGMYYHFTAVLDWKLRLLQERHVGCPGIPDGPKHRAARARRLASARRNIKLHGAEYVKPKKRQTPAEVLETVLQDEANSANKFRDTWYTEKRRKILEDEGMLWAFDVLYVRLCSAVHSDSGASGVMGSMTCQSLASMALQWWGAGAYRIAETFGLRLSADHKGTIRGYHKRLQG